MEPERKVYKLKYTYRMSTLVEVDAYSPQEAKQSVLNGSGHQIVEPVKSEDVELLSVEDVEPEPVFQ